MPSPFPGVDPYVEASGGWLGFHQRFITYLSDWLNERLPSDYAAMIEERVQMVVASPGRSRDGIPDVVVTRDATAADRGQAPSSPAVGGVAVIEPHTLTLPEYMEVHEGYVEVRRFPEAELVGTIELLSPTNKTDPGRAIYLAKRRSMLHRDAHLIEIDLLLNGERLETVEPLPAGDFFAFVSRADRRPKTEVYAWGLKQPLPTIPIPLKAPDPDAPLDLAAVFSRTYDLGRYDRTLRYAALPDEIPPAQREWVAQTAARRG